MPKGRSFSLSFTMCVPYGGRLQVLPRSTSAPLQPGKHYEVTVMADAASTLGHVADPAPQVFILDIGLPDMDGYELARRLRARPENAHALLIALTGYGQAHDRVLAKAAGFDHHFVKPVNWRDLAQVLNELSDQPVFR